MRYVIYMCDNFFNRFFLARKRSVDFLLDIPKIVYELTHVTQTMSWDCGVSCIAMCLNDDQRRDFFKRLDWFCYNEENGFGTR